MNFGILHDLSKALNIATILVMKNSAMISYLDRTLNSGWKTYFIC